MSRGRWAWALSVALTTALTTALSGCAPGLGIPPIDPSASPAGGVDLPGATVSPDAPGIGSPADAGPSTAPSPLSPGSAPSETYSVGVRQLDLSRGDRPLRTVVWYPAAGIVGSDPTSQPVAAGTFPLVLFSHGLTSSPEAYQGLARRLATAGFIVAAPAYPYTSSGSSSYNPADVINQPADASAVITSVLALATTPADLFAGRVDPARVAAVGHSGGAYTTVGMMAGARDYRLRSAIVLAGGSLGGQFRDPAVPMLFVHGELDQVVSYSSAHAVYAHVPWPKAFLTVTNGDHGSYLYAPTTAAFAVARTVLEFLRWTLYADAAALARIPGAAAVAGATSFESTL
jgi:dienelactone hydrolase